MNKALKRAAAAVLISAAAASLISCTLRESSLGGDDTVIVHGTDTETAANLSDYGTITPDARNDGKTVICLDAGHGFGDVGCTSPYGFYEKDITIEITNKIKEQLEASGATVIMTHDGETFPDADEIRAEADRYGIKYKAEKLQSGTVFDAYERSVWTNVLDLREPDPIDIFVSIHVNSITDHPEVNGFSIDYYENNPAVGFLRNLSNSLSTVLTDKFGKEVRVFEDNYEEAYVVTKYTNVPSILVETGYATNANDAADLQNSEWQQSFAENISAVLLDYIE